MHDHDHDHGDHGHQHGYPVPTWDSVLRAFGGDEDEARRYWDDTKRAAAIWRGLAQWSAGGDAPNGLFDKGTGMRPLVAHLSNNYVVRALCRAMGQNVVFDQASSDMVAHIVAECVVMGWALHALGGPEALTAGLPESVFPPEETATGPEADTGWRDRLQQFLASGVDLGPSADHPSARTDGAAEREFDPELDKDADAQGASA